MFKRIVDEFVSKTPAQEFFATVGRWWLKRSLRRVYRDKLQGLIESRTNLAIIDNIDYYQNILRMNEDTLRADLAEEKKKAEPSLSKLTDLSVKINQLTEMKTLRSRTADAVRELEQSIVFLEQ